MPPAQSSTPQEASSPPPQPPVEESKTRRHEHEQAGAENHQSGISGIEVQHHGLLGYCMPQRSCYLLGERGNPFHPQPLDPPCLAVCALNIGAHKAAVP